MGGYSHLEDGFEDYIDIAFVSREWLQRFQVRFDLDTLAPYPPGGVSMTEFLATLQPHGHVLGRSSAEAVGLDRAIAASMREDEELDRAIAESLEEPEPDCELDQAIAASLEETQLGFQALGEARFQVLEESSDSGSEVDLQRALTESLQIY